MGMTSINHWLIVLLIVILLFGAKKIPELAKGIGKGIKTFKSEMKDEESKEEIKTAEATKEVNNTAVNAEQTPKTTTQA